MNLKYSLLVLAGISSLAAQAQTSQPTTIEAPAHRVAFAHEPGANYFISLAGGVGAMFLEGNNMPKLTDRLSWTAALSLGKWHNPYYATRLKVVGGESYTYSKLNSALRNDNYFVGGHYDFMFDVVNFFSTYNPNRVFHIIPYVGVGYEYKFNHTVAGLPNTHAATANGGLQLSFHVAPRVNIFVEGEATYNGFHIRKSYAPDFSNALRLSAVAGLTFNVGRQGFAPVEPLDQAYIDGLQSQINALRAENAELAKRPVNCPDVAVPVADSKVIGNVIYFRINSAVVDKNQMVNVYNIAEYAKSNTETITLVGYADRQTGNPAYNLALSKRRAEAVADILVKKYGISRDRLKIDWKGDTVQPYNENVWNRIVLMSAE